MTLTQVRVAKLNNFIKKKIDLTYSNTFTVQIFNLGNTDKVSQKLQCDTDTTVT